MNKLAGALLASAGVLVLGACQQATSAPQGNTASAEAQVAAKQSPAQRGEYLVTAVAGCDDCHTPHKMGSMGPEPDMTRRLSGHPENLKAETQPRLSGPWLFAGVGQFTAWAGPWGISYTANLTPDQNTGLGIWTEDMFIRAMRTGRHMGQSRPILPPMPWPTYKNMSDDDLKAIFAFLRTLPPITNHVPDPIINEPPSAAAAGQKK